MHAADDRSATETIGCLPHVVASARALIGDKDYRMGPSGIGTRTSPFGSDPPANPASRPGAATAARRLTLPPYAVCRLRLDS